MLRRAPRHRFPNTQHLSRHFPFRKPVSGQRGSRRLIVQIGLQIMPASRHHSPYLSRAPAFRNALQAIPACLRSGKRKMRLYFHSVSRPIFQIFLLLSAAACGRLSFKAAKVTDWADKQGQAYGQTQNLHHRQASGSIRCQNLAEYRPNHLLLRHKRQHTAVIQTHRNKKNVISGNGKLKGFHPNLQKPRIKN